MKNNIKLIADRMFKKQRMLVTAVLALVFVGMSIGYATYYSELNLDGVIALEGIKGNIADLDITEVVKDETSAFEGTFTFDKVKTEKGINFDFKVSSHMGSGSWLRYKLTVVNNSTFDYTYTGSDAIYTFKDEWDANSNYPLKYPVITGMLKGDVIGPNETKTMWVSYKSDSIEENMWDQHTLTSTLILSFEVGNKNIETPKIMAAIEEPVVVFNENKNVVAHFKINNMFDCSQVISFYIDNDELELLSPGGIGIRSKNILNKGAYKTLDAAIKIKRYAPVRDEYKTKLYGKIHLEPEDKEILFDVGELTIKTTGTPTTPAESIGNITVTASFKSFLNLADKRESNVTIKNNNNYDIYRWVLHARVNHEPLVSEVTYYGGHKVVLDRSQDKILFYSFDKNADSDAILNANSSVSIENVQVTLTGVKTDLGLIKTYYEPKFESFTIDAYYNGEWHYGIPVE